MERERAGKHVDSRRTCQQVTASFLRSNRRRSPCHLVKMPSWFASQSRANKTTESILFHSKKSLLLSSYVSCHRGAFFSFQGVFPHLHFATLVLLIAHSGVTLWNAIVSRFRDLLVLTILLMLPLLSHHDTIPRTLVSLLLNISLKGSLYICLRMRG